MSTYQSQFPVGTKVKLKPEVRLEHSACDTATVVGYILPKEGGVKVSPALDGFSYWNYVDLEVVEEFK